MDNRKQQDHNYWITKKHLIRKVLILEI